MRIALVNVYDDRNRGSCALTWAALDLLGQAFPGALITIVPTTWTRTGEDGFRHTRQRHPGAALVDPPFDGAGRSLLVRVASLARRTAEALLLTAHGASGGWVQAVRDADLVVVRGGVSLHTIDGSVRGHAGFLSRLLPLLAARAARRPVVLLGAQIGPFQTATGRLLFRLALRNAHAVIARDALSGREARSITAANRVVLAPDTAIGLRLDKADVSTLFERRGLHPGRPTLALVIGSALRPSESIASHAALLASAAGALLESGLISQILIVVQATEDREASQQLAERLATASLVDDDLDPAQLSSLYARCRLVISSRLHGVILSFLGGTPAISFAPEVSFKERAVLDALGLADLCIPSAAGAGRLAEACIRVLSDAAMPARIEGVVERAGEDVRRAIPSLLRQYPLPQRRQARRPALKPAAGDGE